LFLRRKAERGKIKTAGKQSRNLKILNFKYV